MQTQEIFITFSNDETLRFSSVSQATQWIFDLFLSDIFAVKLRCNADNYMYLQNYIEDIKSTLISMEK